MTATELDNIQPQPSKALVEKIDQINEEIKNGKMWYERAKQDILDAYELAIKDGFTPLQAGDYIRETCTLLSERSLRDTLPKDAKHTNHTTKSKVRNSNPARVPDTPKSLVEEMQPMQTIHVDSICDADVRKMDDCQLPYGRINPTITLTPTRSDIPTETVSELNTNEDRFRDEIEDLRNKISNDYVHKEIYQAATDDIENLKEQVVAKNKEIKEAVEAANKIAEVRGLPQPSSKSDTETIADLRQQITELQEVIAKGMKVEFNTASNLPTEPAPTIGGMVEFPSELFGRFFIDIQKAGRENRHSLFLEVREGKVVSWESE